MLYHITFNNHLILNPMKKIMLFLLLFLPFMQVYGETGPVLTIEGGQISGVKSGKSYVFKNVPYAAPPVGQLRWKEPQPVIPWKGIRKADHFGNAAYQAAHQKGEFYQKEFFFDGDAPYSEDCLYLNIWTPAPGKTNKKLPVAMWIHGGAYTGGWSFEPEMDGEAWAEQGVILVTINYRLGIFGFLAHPELSQESEHKVSGNYGMLDQIAALKWIVRNIAQFGGDPKHITIFGQSAGAASIQTLVTSPLSKYIPFAAIIQSGGGVSERSIMGETKLTEAEAIGRKMMDDAGLTDLNKMRQASTEEIFSLPAKYSKATGKYARLSPIIDGYSLTETFSKAAMGNRISDIPYMIGGTSGDMGMMNADDAIGRFCLLQKEGRAFAYQFAREMPGDSAGAFHSSELWYIFRTLKHCWRPLTQGDTQLSKTMVKYWTNFAKYGNPNGKGKTVWSPYTAKNKKYMVFSLSQSDQDASAMGDPIIKKR
jgi:para-nitrobenzyl esterase